MSLEVVELEEVDDPEDDDEPEAGLDSLPESPFLAVPPPSLLAGEVDPLLRA